MTTLAPVKDFEFLVPPKWLRALKCTTCNNYLSYFPIHVSTDGQNVCGRCPRRWKKHIRNEIYEILSQNVSFPCRNEAEGCSETLVPKRMAPHENRCPYRTSQCLTKAFSGCVVKLLYPDMVKHCHERHSKYFLRGLEFEIDARQSQHYNYIVEHEKELYVFRSRFHKTENSFKFVLPSNVYYKLKLTCGRKKLSVKNSGTEEVSTSQVSLDSLLNPDEYKISVRICLQPKTNTITGDIHRELSDLWKCSSCLRYVLSGTSLSKTTKCPKCQNRFDLNATTIANLVTFPCQNSNRGCSFTGRLSHMQDHNERCQFTVQKCPLPGYCPWSESGKDLQWHLLRIHRSLFVGSSYAIANIDKYCEAKEFANLYILTYSHYSFLLVFLGVRQMFHFSVEMLGEFKDMFLCEIEICQDLDLAPRMAMIRQCSQQSRRKEDVLDNLRKCYIRADHVQSVFQQRDSVVFKFRIFEKQTKQFCMKFKT